MKTVSAGMDGNLYLDEKMNILGSTLLDGRKTEPFLLNFAIGCKKKIWRFESDFSNIEFLPGVMGATYKFEDESCCAKVKVRVHTPLGICADAHLPVCVFSFKIKNTSKKKRMITFGVCMQNPLPEPIHSVADIRDAKAILLDDATAVSVQPDYKTYCICMQHATKALRYADKKQFIFAASEPVRSDSAAIVRCIELGCGESETVQVFVGWHKPNLNFKQDNGEYICFKDGYLSWFNNALDVVAYAMTNIDRLSVIPKELTKKMRDCTESGMYLYKLYENFSAVLAQKPYRLEEFGRGRAFYRNRLKAAVLFAQKDDYRLWTDALVFDVKTEAEQIAFLLDECTDAEQNLLTLPVVADGILTWRESVLDCTDVSILVLRTYRLWMQNGHSVLPQKMWEKLQRLWVKNIQPNTIVEQIYCNSATMCMNKMYDSLSTPVLEKAVSISDCDFSVMRALWISKQLGIEVFSEDTIVAFLERIYMQTDIKSCSAEDVSAYLCLLLHYERTHLALALYKTIPDILDSFLLDVRCFKEVK